MRIKWNRIVKHTKKSQLADGGSRLTYYTTTIAAGTTGTGRTPREAYVGAMMAFYDRQATEPDFTIVDGCPASVELYGYTPGEVLARVPDAKVPSYEEQARKRVENTPELNDISDILFYDWPNWGEHMLWVATAPVTVILEWAELLKRDAAGVHWWLES